MRNGFQRIPQSSQPRERLLEYGPQALSDQELLAILLRTGTAQMNVMELAGRVLSVFPSLFDLKLASRDELQQISGVGQVKALELVAMIELGGRIQKLYSQKLARCGRVWTWPLL